MTGAAEFLKGVASLAWPLLVLFLLLRFGGAIRTVLESAARRKFSLKIAGNELSMDEFSEQQIKLLSDLQAKVAQLETRLSEPEAAALAQTEEASEGASTKARRLLWADDKPRNNSYIAAIMEERGTRVDLALSTDEAIRHFGRGKYDAVVSDMARPEGEKAGLDLAQRIRKIDPEVPFLIFCGSWAARNMREEAAAAGVNVITASSSKLMTELGRIGVI